MLKYVWEMTEKEYETWRTHILSYGKKSSLKMAEVEKLLKELETNPSKIEIPTTSKYLKNEEHLTIDQYESYIKVKGHEGHGKKHLEENGQYVLHLGKSTKRPSLDQIEGKMLKPYQYGFWRRNGFS